MDAFNDGWDEGTEMQKRELGPIYCTKPNSGHNLSCSSFQHEFCYLCSYMDRAIPGTEMSMSDHVDHLVAEEKELFCVVNAVKKIYDTQCRNHCYDANGNAGPEWSTASITRHLLHTNERVFSRYTESVLQHLVLKQANHIVTADDEVDEASRKALLNTIDGLVRWRGRKEGTKRRRVATVKED